MAKTRASKARAAKKSAPPATDASNAEDETPVDYMLRVMRDPKVAPGRRDTMAKSATPYIHEKPATRKKRTNGGDAGLKKRLETARETLAGKIAGLKSDGD